MPVVGVQVMGVWSVDYIPRGTRFGPVTGEIIRQESECGDLPLKHHWKVSALIHLSLYLSQQVQ